MGTKENPAKFDCYSRAEDDEPMFVLLARDPFAPMLVRLWAEMRGLADPDSLKPQEANDCAEEMEQWPSDCPDHGFKF